jgi:hypothetical protein
VRIEFAKSARKHKIGKQRVKEVISSSIPEAIKSEGRIKLRWIGRDSRGLELEIVAVVVGEIWLVIHVMPLEFRRRK